MACAPSQVVLAISIKFPSRAWLQGPCKDRSNSHPSATGSEYGHSHKTTTATEVLQNSKLLDNKMTGLQQLDNLTPPQLARLDTQQLESSTLWQHWRSTVARIYPTWRHSRSTAVRDVSSMAAFTQHGRNNTSHVAAFAQHGSIHAARQHSRSMAAWQQAFTQHGSIHAAWQHLRSMGARIHPTAAFAQHGSIRAARQHSRNMAAFTQHGSIYAAWQQSRKIDSITLIDEFTFGFTYRDEDAGKNVTLTSNILALSSTNYFAPLEADHYDVPMRCESSHPLCGRLLVIEAEKVHGLHYLYNCSSWVDQMTPSTRPIYNIPDGIARVAATSLAQSGIPAKLEFMSEDNSRNFHLSDNWTMSFYMGGSFGWGLRAEGDAVKMAQMISRASIGVLAVMDQVNPRYKVTGSEPWQGVGLEVKWARVIALLVIVGGLQAIAAFPSILWWKKHPSPPCVSPATDEDHDHKM
ncbi:hypothetical protein BDZ91DRAFT_786711 [Kalaharituber pfeilii]|nr:hypothetical protein BDZ91DRAFT_786711 [Kalaharituber pfeilii]